MRGPGNEQVELQIAGEKASRVGQPLGHAGQRVGHSCQVRGRGPLGRQIGVLRLEHHPRLAQVLQLLAVEQKPPLQRPLHVLALVADKGALAHAAFEQAHHGQRAQGFAQGGPPNLKALAQLALRRQPVAGLEDVALN